LVLIVCTLYSTVHPALDEPSTAEGKQQGDMIHLNLLLLDPIGRMLAFHFERLSTTFHTFIYGKNDLAVFICMLSVSLNWQRKASQIHNVKVLIHQKLFVNY